MHSHNSGTAAVMRVVYPRAAREGRRYASFLGKEKQ
jgi:hypothetical protein